jgi:hypothetical protein
MNEFIRKKTEYLCKAKRTRSCFAFVLRDVP